MVNEGQFLWSGQRREKEKEHCRQNRNERGMDVQMSRICDNIEESGIKNFILHVEVGTFSKMHECESCSPHDID